MSGAVSDAARPWQQVVGKTTRFISALPASRKKKGCDSQCGTLQADARTVEVSSLSLSAKTF